jgi:chemotaxis signal transduction protein
MNKSIPLVVFTLDEQRYALHLDAVKRIVRAVEVTPLPKAPQIVLGVVNVQGKVIPVMNLRSRFSLPGSLRRKKTRKNISKSLSFSLLMNGMLLRRHTYVRSIL